jgi:NADPH:quinone reductase-like Zn-dependent oxidoreductase
VGIAAFTAVQGLRDFGQVQAGQKVLINGAAGVWGPLPCSWPRRGGPRSPACAAPATSTWSRR